MSGEIYVKKIPVIDITDLYYPYQDPGDNFDLIMPYALPEIDLKAVILDCTENNRQPVAYHRIPEFIDRTGPREPGLIPVTQLNYIFNKNIPYGVGPFCKMNSPEDTLLDIPSFQQQGIELLLEVLRGSSSKVHIMVFSSLRALAAAYNRDPDLFYEKIERIWISAGASSSKYLEWNVELDQNAFVCIMRSKLPIALFPCATEEGPFDLGKYNSFYKLKDLSLIKEMDKKLKMYLWYAFSRSSRMDFLRAMDDEPDEESLREIYTRPHNIWETAVWLLASGRTLVKTENGSYKMKHTIHENDIVVENGLVPCSIEVHNDGLFDFKVIEANSSNVLIYYRGNPEQNQEAFSEALKDLYQSFKV